MEGIYRCDIRLSAGATHTSFYVGVYLAGKGIIIISVVLLGIVKAYKAALLITYAHIVSFPIPQEHCSPSLMLSSLL